MLKGLLLGLAHSSGSLGHAVTVIVNSTLLAMVLFRMAVCHCTLGAPASVSNAKKSQEYFRQAKGLWEIWKNAHNLLGRPQGVDVLVSNIVCYLPMGFSFERP